PARDGASARPPSIARPAMPRRPAQRSGFACGKATDRAGQSVAARRPHHVIGSGCGLAWQATLTRSVRAWRRSACLEAGGIRPSPADLRAHAAGGGPSGRDRDRSGPAPGQVPVGGQGPAAGGGGPRGGGAPLPPVAPLPPPAPPLPAAPGAGGVLPRPGSAAPAGASVCAGADAGGAGVVAARVGCGAGAGVAAECVSFGAGAGVPGLAGWWVTACFPAAGGTAAARRGPAQRGDTPKPTTP